METVLTLDPFGEEEKIISPEPVLETSAAVTAEEKELLLEEKILNEEEKKQVAEFADKIELAQSASILQYGAGVQKKMADFSEQTLNKVRTKDMGEVGQMLTDIVSELKGFDPGQEEKGLFGAFKRKTAGLGKRKAQFAKAEANVDKICEMLESHQIQLMKDIATMDKMYEVNKEYYKELTMYILAGKKKLLKTKQEELPMLENKAALSGKAEDAQAANDLANLCNRFEKKIHDLELTRMIAVQMAPQIRLVQNNDTLMTEKIQTTIVNTIPLWKSQMVLAVGIDHSKEAAKAQRQVTDMTNELLLKNAETLKMASVETAKESERGIVDMETLRVTNEKLIATLDEVKQIQVEGRAKRQEAESELGRIEGELKNKLLEFSR
ncbi:MAG: toxic anion resistance protein [Lachnospiraceae bacterium]|nr:toxic anion resistance protein [Lachnospiraceae bacterium]